MPMAQDGTGTAITIRTSGRTPTTAFISASDITGAFAATAVTTAVIGGVAVALPTSALRRLDAERRLARCASDRPSPDRTRTTSSDASCLHGARKSAEHEPTACDGGTPGIS